MSRRTIVILVAGALAVAAVVAIIVIATRANAQGAVVEQAAQQGADPAQFRAGRDLNTARRLREAYSREIQGMIAAGPPTLGGERWREVHARLAALQRLYPELR